MVDPIAIHIVTSEFANEHNVIPITRADNKPRIAMSEPSNLIVTWEILNSSEIVLAGSKM